MSQAQSVLPTFEEHILSSAGRLAPGSAQRSCLTRTRR